MKRKLKCGILLLTAIVMALSSFGAMTAFAEGDDEVELVTKEFKCSFAENEEGDDLGSATDLSELFTITAIAGGTALINGNKQGELKMYSQIVIMDSEVDDIVKNGYSFQIDFDSADSACSAMYIRAIDPGAYSLKNDKLGGNPTNFFFYEWDWYNEFNGSGKSVVDGSNLTSSTGGSGVKVFLTADKINVGIKTRMEDGFKVATQVVSFDLPENFKKDGLNTFKYDDDNKGKMDISVNGALLCTVEYGGEPGAYPDGDEGDCEVLYYKNAAIKGADGTELMKIDNARIAAETPLIALGNRDMSNNQRPADVVLFDNLILTWKEAKPVATPTPEITQKPETSATPDAKPTNAPAATEPSKADEGSSSTPIIIVGICAGVVVIAVVAIIIVKKRK